MKYKLPGHHTYLHHHIITAIITVGNPELIWLPFLATQIPHRKIYYVDNDYINTFQQKHNFHYTKAF